MAKTPGFVQTEHGGRDRRLDSPASQEAAIVVKRENAEPRAEKERKRRRRKLKPLIDMAGKKPFPLRGMLAKQRQRLERYQCAMAECAELAAALRVIPLASSKRFAIRAKNLAKSMPYVRLQVKELEDAIEDCGDDDYMQREVARAMNVKFGSGGPAGTAVTTGPENLKKFRARREQALLKLPKETLPVVAAMTDAKASMTIACFISRCLRDRELLAAEISATGDKIRDRRRLRRELRVVEADLNYLNIKVPE